MFLDSFFLFGADGMRKMWMMVVVLIFFGLGPASLRAGTVPWSDGFEAGDFSAWSGSSGNWAVVTSGLSAHSGSRGADIIGATNPAGDPLLLQVSSVNVQDLQFSYWSKVRAGLEAEDLVSVEWSPDNVNWILLDTYTNILAGDWQFHSFNLPNTADNNPNLSFRLLAKLTSSGDRMNVDDFALTVVPEPATLSLLALGMLAGVRRYRHG